MKLFYFKLILILFTAVLPGSCTDIMPSKYTLVLPDVPEQWITLLGEPHWHIQWVDPGGKKQSVSINSGRTIEIEIPVTWTNPVLAWPYWTEHDLNHGLFKPAGALFPFDASADHLYLSWRGGVDAVFYHELGLASTENNFRQPAYFDWQRFRSLFNGETMNKAVRDDPWLADWRFIAEKTISSSFDQRRLVPENVKLITIPVSSGLWYGTSTFAEPLYFPEGENPVFPVRFGLNIWVSEEGILRCNDKTWIFVKNNELGF